MNREILVDGALLQEIMDRSPSIMFLKDLDGRFITINSVLESMLGISREELKGKTDFDIFPAERAEHYRDHDRRVLETGESLQVEEVAELRGEEHVFLAHKFPLRDREGLVYAVCGISHDITARKRAEQALKENERISALANIVANVAHELNNPLEVAIGAIYMTMSEESISSEGIERLKLAQQQILKAAGLARRTLEAAQELT